MTTKTRRSMALWLALALTAVVLWPTSAQAQDDEPGSLVLGLETGAMFPFTELDPHVAVAIEIGYLLPFLDRQLEVFLATGWSPPGRSFEDGPYSAEVTVHQLHFSLGPRWRFLDLSSLFNVHLAAGPRLNLLRSLSSGNRDGESFHEYQEDSTEIGFFTALGGEVRLGPGAFLLDIDFGWSPLPHRITGDTSTINLTTTLGYRFFIL